MGGYFRLPNFVQDGATAFRAHQILFASERVRKIHAGKLEARDQLTIDDVILTLGDIAQGRGELVAGRPARLVVNDADLAARLQTILAGSGTAVVFEEQPAQFQDMEQFFIEAHRKSKGLPDLPHHLSVKGMNLDHVRAFAEAAFDLREAAPWRHVSSEDLIEISPKIMDMRYLRVLGNGSLEEGLMICPSDKPSADQGVIAVNFEYPENAPLCDVDLFDEKKLPIHEGQYPVLLHIQGRRFRRLSPQNLALTVGLMRALAEATESDFDRGAWSRTVESQDGSLEFRFRIPSLLQWRQGQEEGRPRKQKQSIESQKLAIGRLLEGGVTPEGLNELIAQGGGDMQAEAPPMTPEEQVEGLGAIETEVHDLETFMKERGHSPQLAANQNEMLDNPELQKQLRALLDGKMMAWLDEANPALDMKTPREALKFPTYSEKVKTLIRSMPNPTNQIPYEVPRAAMFRELGLT